MKNYKFNINGNNYSVEIKSAEGSVIGLEVNGTPYTVTLDKEVKEVKTPKLVRTAAVPSTDKAAETRTSGKVGNIVSPLPGTVLDVKVQIGDKVSLGQTVLVLEAMKMENNIASDKEGTVKEIKARQGDSVMEGDVLIIIGE